MVGRSHASEERPAELRLSHGRCCAALNTHLLLALIFYTLFTLIGGVMRIVRYDPLDRKRSSSQATYWHRRETPLLNRKHYERQF